MTVPALRRKILDRSTSRSPRDCTVGQRYDGISSRNGVRPVLRTEDLSAFAVTTAARNPSAYKPSIAAARAPRKAPRIGLLGMNAAMINVYTGSRAEHV